jgi:hypothetical protein
LNHDPYIDILYQVVIALKNDEIVRIFPSEKEYDNNQVSNIFDYSKLFNFYSIFIDRFNSIRLKLVTFGREH